MVDAKEIGSWLPMAMAPKDGTRVLIAGHMEPLVWSEDIQAYSTRWDPEVTVREARYRMGYWEVCESKDNTIRPLMWQPMPAPPAKPYEVS